MSTPITYFYEGIEEEGARQITLHQRMQLEIARNFAEIRNEKHQEAVSQLARVQPGSTTNGAQRVFRDGLAWEIEKINEAADDFTECNGRLVALWDRISYSPINVDSR